MSNKIKNKDIQITKNGLVIKCADNKFTKTYIKQKGESNILVTKAMFNRYREVQYDGAWNMMMDWEEAANDAELSPVSYWTILNNYSDLARHYGKMEENNNG